MAADNGQMSFRRGVMSLVILGLLKKQDMYGYQLVQETERQSGGRIVTQEGSLYPVLYKLVDQGLISDRKVLVGRRMTRVYYHLESAGEQRLKELIREYEEVTNGVLQIIEGCDMDGLECPSSAVSMGSARGTAGQQEAEEMDASELLGSLQIQRKVVAIVLAAATLLVLMRFAFRLAAYMEFYKNMNGYAVVEVIEFDKTETDKGVDTREER